MSIFSKMSEDLRTLEEQGTAEETFRDDEPLTPEEEARLDFFEKLSDRMDSFFDTLEDMLETFGEDIARLIAPEADEIKENVEPTED